MYRTKSTGKWGNELCLELLVRRIRKPITRSDCLLRCLLASNLMVELHCHWPDVFKIYIGDIFLLKFAGVFQFWFKSGRNKHVTG
jgi:hypothetical protein